MPLGRVTSPTIINATMTAGDTEYSETIPPQTVRLRIQARAADCRFSFRAGQVVSGQRMTVKAAQPAFEVDDITGVRTIYLASTTAGAVVELLCWT